MSTALALARLEEKRLGRVWLLAGAQGLVRVLLAAPRRQVLEEVARRGGRLHQRPDWTAPAKRQLYEYFAGRRWSFRLRLAPPTMSDFSRRVLQVLAGVAYGQLVTYGELARRAGHPRAARAVGRVLAANPLPIIWPCHRVVATAGPGGFSAGLEVKRALLLLEGRALPG